jgi:hypothetical protein
MFRLHYVRINGQININGQQTIKGIKKIRHIHVTPRKISADLNTHEDLNEAPKSPRFCQMSRDQCTLTELNFKLQLKNQLRENRYYELRVLGALSPWP